MLLQSPAKVNLALNILGKDENTGYHFIETVLHEYTKLYDEIDLRLNETPSIDLRCNNPNVPKDQTNSIFKAVRLLQKTFSISQGIKVCVNKKIPHGSGFGGASSNAAQLLKTLNQKWRLDQSVEKLEELAALISMDTPFFIRGGTAFGTHYGEKIAHLPSPKGINIRVHLSDIFISTSWAYQQIKKYSSIKDREKTKNLISALKKNNPQDIISNINNDFEDIIFERYHILEKKKNDLKTSENKIVHLNGSGSSLVSYSI